MALLRGFRRISKDKLKLHDEAECGYIIDDINGERMLLIETYGKPTRKIPGKISQSIQIDSAAAERLIKILREAFPDLAV